MFRGERSREEKVNMRAWDRDIVSPEGASPSMRRHGSPGAKKVVFWKEGRSCQALLLLNGGLVKFGRKGSWCLLKIAPMRNKPSAEKKGGRISKSISLKRGRALISVRTKEAAPSGGGGGGGEEWKNLS